MTTTTNDEIKAIQDREAQARGRVITAGSSYFRSDEGQSEQSPDSHAARIIEAAMMELAAVWREQAAWWEASGKRGGKGAAKELIQAAGRLAGFAVGLSTRGVEMPEPATPDRGGVELPGMWEQSDLTGGETDMVDETAVAAELASLEAERRAEYAVGDTVTVAGIEFTKIGDNPFGSLGMWEPTESDASPAAHEPQEATPVQPSPAVPAIIDNPFTSPSGPGAGVRPAVAPLPYSVLPVIASQLEPRTQLSHSFVETFEGCSLKSMLDRASRHGLIGPTRPTWSTIGGNAFHAVIGQVERDALAHPGRVPVSSRSMATAAGLPDHSWAVVDVDGVWAAALDAAMKEALAKVEGSAYSDPATWHASNSGKEGFDWWRVEGALMVHRYLEFHDAAWRSTRTLLRTQPLDGVAPVPALEQHYVHAIGASAESGTSALTTQGYIDAVWYRPADTLVGESSAYLDIVDWKTGSRRPVSTFQLGEYAHGLSTILTGHFAASATMRGSYWLARKGEYTPQVVLLDKHPADEMIYRYRQAALGSSLGLAAPHVTDMCSACSVRDYCPAQATR